MRWLMRGSRDVATDEGCKWIVGESLKVLGGLDVIVSNAVGFILY